MRRWAGRAGRALLCMAFGMACTPESTPTQLLVVVDSDLVLDSEAVDALRTVEVTVLSANREAQLLPPRQFAVGANPQRGDEYRLPLSFAVTPYDSAESTPFRVVVTGRNGRGEDVAERQVITAFRAGASLRLDLFLAAKCLRELCRENEQRTGFTCDIDTGVCGAAPESFDLPTASASPVSGYERPKPITSGGSSDGGSAELCHVKADCDDGLYCNGLEECDPRSVKANPSGCVAGRAPSCAAQETCDESGDRCTACAMVPDGDKDGVHAKACGGSDCNDGDPAIAPNKSEICDGKDNDCDERTDVTSAGSVCTIVTEATDGSTDSGTYDTDAGTRDSGTADAAAEGGTSHMDSGATRDASEAGPSDAAMEASGPDANVPLTSRCTMGSTAACSSFVNAWDVEVPMGPYGAVMERNVGAGFEAPNEMSTSCPLFLDAFGLAASVIEKLVDVTALNMALHTVYRPARWVTGQKYPLIIWGNGTCMQPETYGGLLRSLASQGFIVVAPNSRNVGSGEALGIALNFALAAAASAQGPLGGRIDTTKIGVMGHGQGGLGAGMIASDARIQALLSFNGLISATKPFLVVSGDRDLLVESSAVLQQSVSAANKAAFVFLHMVPADTAAGFITLLTQPNRVTGFTNAWWKYLLDNDATARTWFAGASCMLCGRPSEFDYGQNGL